MWWKVEGAVWKARDDDGRADLNGGEEVSCMRVLQGSEWSGEDRAGPASTVYGQV